MCCLKEVKNEQAMSFLKQVSKNDTYINKAADFIACSDR